MNTVCDQLCGSMIEIQGILSRHGMAHFYDLSEDLQSIWAFCTRAFMVLLEESCYIERSGAWNEQNASV